MALDANNPNDVKEGRLLKVPIQGPGNANRLLIFTGTAVTNFAGPAESQGEGAISTGLLTITLLDAAHAPQDFIRSATFASIAAETMFPFREQSVTKVFAFALFLVTPPLGFFITDAANDSPSTLGAWAEPMRSAN